MSFDNIEHSRFLTRILIKIGLWPVAPTTQTWQARHPNLYRLAVQGLLGFLFIALLWLDAILSPEIDHALKMLNLLLTEVALIFKILNIWRHTQLASGMLRDWEFHAAFVLQTSEERALWKRTQKKFGVISVVYVLFSVLTCYSLMLVVFFDKQKELPLSFWTPFDLHNARNFWAAYTYEVIAAPLTATSNCCLDMINCYLLMHCGLCYQIIGMRFKRLGEVEDDDRNFEDFISIIKFYQTVKRCTKQCERIISWPTFVQILLSSSVICFSAYEIKNLSIADNPSLVSHLIQFMTVMSVQIYLPCYYANEITTNSLQLSHKLYCSNWTGLSKRNRRLIYFLMEDLKNPVIIRAGGFFEIGLPIFSKTMKNAYSLFAFLLNVKN